MDHVMNGSIAVYGCYAPANVVLATRTIAQPTMANSMFAQSTAPNTVSPNVRYTFAHIR